MWLWNFRIDFPLSSVFLWFYFFLLPMPKGWVGNINVVTIALPTTGSRTLAKVGCTFGCTRCIKFEPRLVRMVTLNTISRIESVPRSLYVENHCFFFLNCGSFLCFWSSIFDEIVNRLVKLKLPFWWGIFSLCLNPLVALGYVLSFGRFVYSFTWSPLCIVCNMYFCVIWFCHPYDVN